MRALAERTRDAFTQIQVEPYEFQVALLDGDLTRAVAIAQAPMARANAEGRTIGGSGARARIQEMLVPLILLGRAQEALALADALGDEPEDALVADCHRAALPGAPEENGRGTRAHAFGCRKARDQP